MVCTILSVYMYRYGLTASNEDIEMINLVTNVNEIINLKTNHGFIKIQITDLHQNEALLILDSSDDLTLLDVKRHSFGAVDMERMANQTESGSKEKGAETVRPRYLDHLAWC